MAFTNNVMIVRHELLAKLVKMWKEKRLAGIIEKKGGDFMVRNVVHVLIYFGICAIISVVWQ